MTERRSPTEGGTSLYVGTVSPAGVPAGCRAIALVSNDAALKSVTVYLPMATSRDVVMNVAATKRLAIVSSYPPDHTTVQLKGSTTAVRLAGDDEAPFVEDRLHRFADVLHAVGIPRRVSHAINHWPAFAIEMTVEQIFEQTPGPNAGTLIR